VRLCRACWRSRAEPHSAFCRKCQFGAELSVFTGQTVQHPKPTRDPLTAVIRNAAPELGPADVLAAGQPIRDVAWRTKQ